MYFYLCNDHINNGIKITLYNRWSVLFLHTIVEKIFILLIQTFTYLINYLSSA